MNSNITFAQIINKKDFINLINNFNKSSFLFSHNLGDNPLFGLSTLAEISEIILASSHPEKFVCRSNNVIFADSKLGDMEHKECVATAISNLKESNSWIKLSGIQETIPEFNSILQQFILELEEITGLSLRQEITASWLTIFMGSPNLIVPYHIDPEVNFLLQVHGEKEVNLFNPSDRSILTEEELEHYYIGDQDSAIYQEKNQSKANVYKLIPGQGVHHPSHAPHWIKNGNSPSVSVSFSFSLRSSDLQARIYQINYYLRKLGIKPTPPGKSFWKDSYKINTIGMFSKPNPQDHDEMIFSGIERIKYPFKSLKQIIKPKW